jgi:hypothetical protein
MMIEASQKITIQYEISLEQLYQMIVQLSCEQRIELADEIKREALREQWRALSAKLPDRPEITEEDIINEVKVFRSELHETT